MRADQLLVERGLAASRAQAQRLITAGVRWRAGEAPALVIPGRACPGPDPGTRNPQPEWRAVAKNGDDLPSQAEIELLDRAESRYISRGGLKLEGALRDSGVDVAGTACLDVGQSTGGFTDCLLAQGAACVVGVDVGHGQLHERLRADPRVACIEKCNARTLCATDLIAAEPVLERCSGRFPSEFRLVTGDLSFISLTLVLPALVPLLAQGGDLLLLVKPQFELQPSQLGKGGVVKDATLHAEVERRVRGACTGLGLEVRGWFESAIRGGDGNREFFIHARKPA